MTDRCSSGQPSARRAHVSGLYACNREDSDQNILISQSCPVEQAGNNCVGSERQLLPREQALALTTTSRLYPFLSPEQRAGVIYLLVLSPRATGAVLASQASKESRVPEAHRSVPWHELPQRPLSFLF